VLAPGPADKRQYARNSGDVSVKLKYALPLAQVLLAISLLWASELWFKAARGTMDMPGPAPAFTLLILINAPLAPLRALWYRHVSTVWDDVTLVAAIGLLWYWVASNIYSWQEKRRVCMFSWAPLRLAGDMLAVGAGAFWIVVFVADRSAFTVESRLGVPWTVAVVSLPLAWSLVLIFFFGRDFVQCVLRR